MKNTPQLFLDWAARASCESHAKRLKVGAVLVKNGQPLSVGWNGTAPGRDNVCEIIEWDSHKHDGYTNEYMTNAGFIFCTEKADWYKIITKHEVIHAESNLLKKCLTSGISTVGATLYMTTSPCFDCAKLLAGIGLNEIIYTTPFRDLSGVEFLKECGETIYCYKDNS